MLSPYQYKSIKRQLPQKETVMLSRYQYATIKRQCLQHLNMLQRVCTPDVSIYIYATHDALKAMGLFDTTSVSMGDHHALWEGIPVRHVCARPGLTILTPACSKKFMPPGYPYHIGAMGELVFQPSEADEPEVLARLGVFGLDLSANDVQDMIPGNDRLIDDYLQSFNKTQPQQMGGTHGKSDHRELHNKIPHHNDRRTGWRLLGRRYRKPKEKL